MNSITIVNVLFGIYFGLRAGNLVREFAHFEKLEDTPSRRFIIGIYSNKEDWDYSF